MTFVYIENLIEMRESTLANPLKRSNMFLKINHRQTDVDTSSYL